MSQVTQEYNMRTIPYRVDALSEFPVNRGLGDVTSSQVPRTAN